MWLQELVAAGHRETVWLTHRGRSDYLGVDGEIRDHPFNERELLVVLLAEDGGAGVGGREQCPHHGEHPGEVTRACDTFI